MAIIRVQGNAKGTAIGTNVIIVTMDSLPIAGNLLIATVGLNLDQAAGYTVSSISQEGVSWTPQVAFLRPTLHNDVEIWAGIVGSNASNIITITLTGVPAYGAVADVCEYAGVESNNFLDQTATNSGYSTAPDTGTTSTTTVPDELFIGATVTGWAAQINPRNGFTLMDGQNLAGYMMSLAYLEKIVSEIGTANSGTDDTGYDGSTVWSGCIATFKAAGTPPPPQTGTLEITTIPNSSITLDGILVTTPYGPVTWTPGSVTIVYGDISGYITPPPETVTVVAGEATTVNRIYSLIPPPVQGSLHIEGKYIKDNLGNIFSSKGVGRFNYGNDPAGTWNDVYNTFIESNVRLYLQAMQSWGINTLNLQTNAENWIGNLFNYQYNLKRTIELCQEYGIYVIFNLAEIRSGQWYADHPTSHQTTIPLAAYTTTDEKAIFPTDQALYDYWANVADTLKVYPNVIFDIYNEPGVNISQQPTAEETKAWFTAVQACINAIRATGATNIISVQWRGGSVPGWMDLSWVETCGLTDPLNNILYHTHLYSYPYNPAWYSAWDYNSALAGLTTCKFNYVVDVLNKPLIVGEIGVDMYADNTTIRPSGLTLLREQLQWARNMFKICNDWGIGYNAWNWDRGQWALINSRTDLTPTLWGQVLIDAINPVPTPIMLYVVAGTNGTVSPSGSQTLTVGQNYDFTAIPDSAYGFDHWNLNGTSKGSSNPLTLLATADMNGDTLTALFTAIPPAQATIIILVSGNGTTDLAPGTHQFNVGDTVSISAIPQAGNQFKQWTIDGTSYTDNPLHLTVTADMNGKSLTAIFQSVTPTTAGFPTWIVIPVSAIIIIGGYILSKRGKNHRG